MSDAQKPHEPPQGGSQTSRLVGASGSSAPQGEEPKTKIYQRSTFGPIRQGEILSGLIQAHLNIASLDSADGPRVDYKTHPYAMVVTQDCEVIQDYDPREQRTLLSDKLIPNVLFCELITAEELRKPAHGKGLDSQIWKRVRQNKDERYQFLEKVPPQDDALEVGLPELGIDFKRYFSIPTEEVYYRLKSEAKRRCRLVNPYLEHFSTRFFNYQARVALPAEHHSA